MKKCSGNKERKMNVLELPEGSEEDDSYLKTNLRYVKQMWLQKGQGILYWHRLRGPALIYEDGTEIWSRYGR